MRLARLGLILGFVLFAATAEAQSVDPQSVETIKLAITPAAEPNPALKYRLFSTFAERKLGNAALPYSQAALSYKPTPEQQEQIDKLLKAPRADFVRLGKELKASELLRDGAIELLTIAASRERCDWELPLREKNAISVLLPELEHMRGLARMMALKARLHVAKQEYPQAIGALRVGYAMSYHIGRCPTLIHGLVAISIARQMDDVVLELACSPGAPNLYWALTTRPSPLVDLRAGLDGEMSIFELSFPRFRDAVEKDPGAVNWNVEAADFRRELQIFSAFSSDYNPNMPKDALEGLAQAVPAVKVMMHGKEYQEFVVAAGVPRARVEKMGAVQLLMAYDTLKYDEHRDRMFRWLNMPLYQAREGLKVAEQQLRNSKDELVGLVSFGRLLMPSIYSVRETHACAEREGDVLRLVEALRMYAATHAGKLPKSLDELHKASPIPLDCVTGKAFDYELTGEQAKLTLREERRGSRRTTVYEITVGK